MKRSLEPFLYVSGPVFVMMVMKEMPFKFKMEVAHRNGHGHGGY